MNIDMILYKIYNRIQLEKVIIKLHKQRHKAVNIKSDNKNIKLYTVINKKDIISCNNSNEVNLRGDRITKLAIYNKESLSYLKSKVHENNVLTEITINTDIRNIYDVDNLHNAKNIDILKGMRACGESDILKYIACTVIPRAKMIVRTVQLDKINNMKFNGNTVYQFTGKQYIILDTMIISNVKIIH